MNLNLPNIGHQTLPLPGNVNMCFNFLMSDFSPDSVHTPFAFPIFGNPTLMAPVPHPYSLAPNWYSPPFTTYQYNHMANLFTAPYLGNNQLPANPASNCDLASHNMVNQIGVSALAFIMMDNSPDDQMNEKGLKRCRSHKEESAHLVLPNGSCCA